MNTILFAAVEDAAASPARLETLSNGLKVSGIGMLGIFCVMGLFAALIVLLTSLFPDGDRQA